MTTLKVFGHADESLKEVDFGKGLKNFSVSDAVQFSTDRAESSTQVIEGLGKDDVVELIFEEGIHRWVTVEELEQDYKYQLSRGGEAGVLEIPSRLRPMASAWAVSSESRELATAGRAPSNSARMRTKRFKRRSPGGRG